MTVDQLSLFNGALLRLGERKLASLTEAREPQRVLTDIWNDGNGAIQTMLEKGLWHFAMRSQQLTYSPSVTPPFGYQFAYNKSTDWVRTAAVCMDPFYNQPLTQYDDEAGYLFCNLNTIYVKFVSKDASYGYNMALWPQAFIEYFECYLAMRGAKRITQSPAKEAEAEKAFKEQGTLARSLNAMDEPAKFFPAGSWTTARRGRFTARRQNSETW
jgi:hypothetical protein